MSVLVSILESVLDYQRTNFLLFFVVVGQAGGGVDREVFLNVKHGVEAKNYEDVSYCWGNSL